MEGLSADQRLTFASCPAAICFPRSPAVWRHTGEHPEAARSAWASGDDSGPLPPAVLRRCTPPDEQGSAEIFRGYGPEQGYPFCGRPWLGMISRPGARRSRPTRSLSAMAPKATAATSGTCSDRGTGWPSAIRCTRPMWTPMRWPGEPENTIRCGSAGRSCAICPVRRRTVLRRNGPMARWI